MPSKISGTRTPSSEQIRTEVYERLGSMLRAIASPVRLRLIQLLAQSPKTVEQLANLSGQSVANTSQHLLKMAKEGVLKVRREGLMRIYSVANPGVLQLWEDLQDLAHELVPELSRAEEQLTRSSSLQSSKGSQEILREVKDNKAVLLDVRPPQEAESSPLELAMNLPLVELKDMRKKLPKSKTIYVVCRGRYCSMASDAVQALREQGYDAYRLRESPFRLRKAFKPK